MSNAHSKPARPIVARLVRVLSIPIILFWLLLAVALSMISPPLEEVATQHAVSMTPQQAPAFQAMMHIGRIFQEFDTDSSAMVVLEGQDKLGDSAHQFYSHIVDQLQADTAHVENVQDFWSDPLTAAGSQSPDGKAAYVQVFLRGNQGTTPSIESVTAVRKIVDQTPAPPGVKAYVAGNTAVVADTNKEGRKSLSTMALVSIGVILFMLLLVYRSIVT
ncbi:MAG: putative drug exporter of the superfamily, partial [Mycobacterium sp.]|nr:putative drug exporter of the superfamily [Mycobacterium sp.]